MTCLAGLDAAGKGDHIGAIDERLAGGTVTDNDLQKIFRKAGFCGDLGAEERRQRRQFRRL